MWDRKTDRLFLELREDAVLLFDQQTMQLIYMNSAAKTLLGNYSEQISCTTLFPDPAVERLIRRTVATGRMSGITLDSVPWFPERAVVHITLAVWDDVPAIGIAIDRRPYGPPAEAMQMMKAVLTSAYFTALRIDLQEQSVSVVSDKNPLMNTQAKFASYADFIQLYAEAMIHPEDRAQFLASFTVEQLRLFVEANTMPACTVRRSQQEEYRWASFAPASVNEHIVLLLGKDSNEQRLQQERSDRYRTELKNLSMRNHYIISGVGDIFRLMLHIDLQTGETIICSLHPSLRPFFKENDETVYQFDAVCTQLLRLVHPDDLHLLDGVKTLDQLCASTEEHIILEYRRITLNEDPDTSARWTRAVITFLRGENGIPTGAIYAVQDIDDQKRQDLAMKHSQETLTTQFYTLIENRFLWFIEYDFGEQIARCYQITNHTVQPPQECPFGQFFERLIMPNCHPEDFKRVALSLLPRAVEDAYRSGKRQVSVEYRHRSAEGGWKYVQAEMYLQTDENQKPRAMLYVSDIDSEVQSRDSLSKSEHEQLVLRRKFSMMVQDSFVSVGEVDLDADRISHYQIVGSDMVLREDPLPFSAFCEAYPKRFIHPDHQDRFLKQFSYQQILHAARERTQKIKHLFLVDINEDKQYYWCNIAVRFFRDENGKAFLMTHVENVNDEIRRRDRQLHDMFELKQQLQTNLRNKERARIRKAHLFLNIASNFQLALNQIYATLEHLEHELPDDTESRSDFRKMFSAYERLSAMTDCAKDVLLLENNQLPILKEPTPLPRLIDKIKQKAIPALRERNLQMMAYTSHVTHETVFCDSNRLLYIIENVFVNVMQSLPSGSAVTLQLTQSAIAGAADQAMYEFSLVTHGDRVSQDIQSGLCSPIPKSDPLRSLEDVFVLHQNDEQQHSLYLSKRLIALMGGTLEFVRLPQHASAVILRLPLVFFPDIVMFPHRFCFGKRVFVWDSQQSYAMATMEMLREIGCLSEWQADFEHACAYLRMAVAQNQPYAIIFVRQSDLNRQNRCCLDELLQLHPDTPILVLADAPADAHTKPTVSSNAVRYVRTPLFRSVLAEHLRSIADNV